MIRGHFLEGVFHGPARSSSSVQCYGVKMFYLLALSLKMLLGLPRPTLQFFVLSLTQRNAANARQDRSCNTTNGCVSSIKYHTFS